MAALQGSLVAIVTPMQEDGTLDLEAFRRLIDWHIKEGTDGIVVVGTTGESPTVDFDEHGLLIKTAVDHAARRVPVIAGTGANSTSEAIELAAYAKEAGADLSLSVVPYYNKPTQEGLYRHFKAIAEAVDLPHDRLQRARPHGCRSAERYGAAARADSQHRRHQGRDGEPRARLRADPAQAARIPRSTAATMPPALPLMLLGGHGVISVTANVAPRLMHEMCAAALAGDVAQGARAQQPIAAAASQPVPRSQSHSGQMGRAADGPDQGRHPAAAHAAVRGLSRAGARGDCATPACRLEVRRRTICGSVTGSSRALPSVSVSRSRACSALPSIDDRSPRRSTTNRRVSCRRSRSRPI